MNNAQQQDGADNGVGSTDLLAGFGRIVLQELTPDGVWTTYSGGERILLPYEVAENGEQYADLDPNGDIFG